MRLPAYWWLLAATLIQAGYFIRAGVLHLSRKGVRPLSRPEICLFGASGLAGLAYGAVQRDPLFFLGQICLLILYYLIQTRNHDHQS